MVTIKESQNINFLTVQWSMGKLQVHEKRVNDIQEDVSVQTLFLKHYSKEKQDDSNYAQGGKECGQGREKWGRDKFERGDTLLLVHDEWMQAK